jgi:hypothetical protein
MEHQDFSPVFTEGVAVKGGYVGQQSTNPLLSTTLSPLIITWDRQRIRFSVTQFWCCNIIQLECNLQINRI